MTGSGVEEMETEMQSRIKKTVEEILEGADMEAITEFKVRSLASEKLGLDLSIPERKRFVREVVESFLLSNAADPAKESGKDAGKDSTADASEKSEKTEMEGEDEGEEECGRKRGREARERDDEGNLVVCRLSGKRKVTIQDFRGRTLVSIREYYDRGGKELPSHKGISLTVEQWASLRDAVPSVEMAIEKLQARTK
ncbi:transcriptional coactivator p15 (PC4) family protein (KELP) [Wolffia australiana]